MARNVLTTLHYSAIGLFIGLCGYLCYDITAKLALFEQKQLLSLTARDLAELATVRFDLISDINLYSYLALCASAVWVYIKHRELTPFFANLVGYFIILCITYFWLGDTLFAFKKHHEIDEGGFSASLMIVPIKLAMAAFMGYVSYVLAKHIAHHARRDIG